MNNQIIESLKSSMLLVRGGQFKMGDTHKLYRPLFGKGIDVTNVVLDDFHISSRPVTNEVWDTVMNTVSDGSKNIPKVNVSWHEVYNFIVRLNKLTDWDFRLPTEAEWEYAARGGELSHDTLYSGSSVLDSVGWYERNSKGELQNAGMLQSNELGIYDMSGGVREWCSDIYASAYAKGERLGMFSSERQPVRNPTGALSGSKRVVRGGSFLTEDKACWVFYRDSLNSTDQAIDVGFRLAY